MRQRASIRTTQPVDPGAVDAFFAHRDRVKAAAPTSASNTRTALPPLTYAPHPGDLPDPGEVVWTKVSYSDDPRVGKDRPVLIIGRDHNQLIGLALTSKTSGPASARLSIGPGPWDEAGRDSYVRLDQVVKLRPVSLRRSGGRVSDATFWLVADALTAYHDGGSDVV